MAMLSVKHTERIQQGKREWGFTAELNPLRVLAVSLCLLTLSYSIDFFINPLSKCFSLPHSSNISPTQSSTPPTMFLVQLFHLVVRADIRVSLQTHNKSISHLFLPFYFFLSLLPCKLKTLSSDLCQAIFPNCKTAEVHYSCYVCVPPVQLVWDLEAKRGSWCM